MNDRSQDTGTDKPKKPFAEKVSSRLRSEIVIGFLLIVAVSVNCFIKNDCSVNDLTACAICLVLLCLVQYLAKRFLIKDVSDRHNRTGAYAVTGVSYIICTIMMWVFFSDTPFVFISLSLSVGAVLMMIGNHFTKVSVHCGTVALVSIVFSVLFWPYGIVTVILVPLVIWARVKCDAHTEHEAVYGTFIGFITPLLLIAMTKIFSWDIILRIF